MKNVSIILSSLALVGVIALFGMKMSGSKGPVKAASAKNDSLRVRIAYVNIDSLEANYEYLKSKQKELEARKESMSNELQRSQKRFQEDYLAVQRKAQAGTLTQAEYEAAEKRLRQMSQSLESREASLTEELLKEQDDFNRDLKKRLDDFLSEYNEDKDYDYILSYSNVVNNILLANESLDITNEVIEGMNKEYAKTSKSTDKKKKENK